MTPLGGSTGNLGGGDDNHIRGRSGGRLGGGGGGTRHGGNGGGTQRGYATMETSTSRIPESKLT